MSKKPKYYIDLFQKVISFFIIVTFSVTSIIPNGYAQTVAPMPQPGIYVGLSAPLQLPRLSGIRIFSDNPFEFEFLLDLGDLDQSETEQIETHSERLMRYFLIALTVPEKDLWVNLSPYEQDRIVPDDLGLTELGRDMLAQDYLLKQIASSLHHPDYALGEQFWGRIQDKMNALGLADSVDVDLFNKVWVVPKKATIYEDGDRAYIVESELDVLMEEDYLALAEAKTTGPGNIAKEDPVRRLSIDTMKEIVIPELQKEVNEGENFATLRQIYHSLILARWYKGKIRNSIINQTYSDQHKTAGNELADAAYKRRIYDQYVQAFEKGAYRVLKENYDPQTQSLIPKRYFSGGIRGEIADMASLTKSEGRIPDWIRRTIQNIKTTTMVLTISLGILSGGSVLAQDEQDAIVSQATDARVETADVTEPDVYQVTETEEALMKFNVSLGNLDKDVSRFSAMLSADEINILQPQLEERLTNTNRNVRVATALTLLESDSPDLRKQALDQLGNEEFSEQVVFERLAAVIENWENESDDNIKAAGLAINNQSLLDKGRYSKQLVPVMMKSYMLQELYHPNREMRDIAHEVVDSMKFWFKDQYKITKAEVDEIKRQRTIENLQSVFSDVRPDTPALNLQEWNEFVDSYYNNPNLQKFNAFLKSQFENYSTFVSESNAAGELPSFDKFIVKLVEEGQLKFYENEKQIMVADNNDKGLFVVDKTEYILSSFNAMNNGGSVNYGRDLMILLAMAAMGVSAFQAIRLSVQLYILTPQERPSLFEVTATVDKLGAVWRKERMRELKAREHIAVGPDEFRIPKKDQQRMEEAFEALEAEVLPDKREILEKLKPVMLKHAGRAVILDNDTPKDILARHLYVLTGLRNYPPFYLIYGDGEFSFKEMYLEESVVDSPSNFTLPLTTEKGRKIIRGNWTSYERVQDSEVAQAFIMELFGEPPGFFERLKQSLKRTPSSTETDASSLKTPVGGIDFASDKLTIETQSTGADPFTFTLDPQAFEGINIDGLIPQIQTIAPVNLPQYLRIQ